MKTKVLVICPKHKPLKDGLAGHNIKMIETFSKISSVSLLTGDNIPVDSTIKTWNIVTKWSFLELIKRLKQTNEDYDVIYIQYVPSLYGHHGGVNLSILLFFLYLKFLRREKIVFMFHEVYFPFIWNFKMIILSLIHKLMFTISLFCSDISFFSTKFFLQRAKYFTWKWKTLFHQPAGATIENFCMNKAETRDKVRFVLFGEPHPTKNYDLIFDVFSKAVETRKDIELVIIGPTYQELRERCQLPHNFKDFTLLFTQISDQEVSTLFSNADYLLAYFSDGVTTRRSSVISAIAHGLNIITTISDVTEEVFLNQDGIFLFSLDDEHFKNELIQFIKSVEINDIEHGNSSLIQLNKTYFSWENKVMQIFKETGVL